MADVYVYKTVRVTKSQAERLTNIQKRTLVPQAAILRTAVERALSWWEEKLEIEDRILDEMTKG